MAKVKRVIVDSSTKDSKKIRDTISLVELLYGKCIPVVFKNMKSCQ